jgi:hypothetical protein
MSAGSFIQRRRVAPMAGLGARPLATAPDAYGDVLVMVTRGDGLPELKAIAPCGAVRSLTHPHEDAPRAVVA